MAEIKGLADDLDGTPQWIRPVKSHTFSLDGVEHKIDLHDENAAQMRADFAKWINASRQIGQASASTGSTIRALKPTTHTVTRRVAVTKKGKKQHRDPEQLKAERSWLRSQGHQVSPFGKVPDNLHALWEGHLATLGQGGFAGSPFRSEDLFSSTG